jgi:TonB family protein
MPALTSANLALYAAQAALLIGALALGLAALQPSAPFRLAACRVVLVMLLVLPWQGLLREPGPAASRLEEPTAGGVFADAVDARVGHRLPWGVIVATVVGAGVACRSLWLLAGLVRLRRIASRLADGGEHAEVADLQAALGTAATVRFVDAVPMPVTFGVAPAVVLLPAALLEAPADRRRAVICHELLHVRRRDWLWVLGEEASLAALWFHPAVWWLVGELQLAREQVVDRLTVAATGTRRAYMDALFSAADAPSAPPLLAGFLRRRHLSRRLVSLAEEVAMSRVRLALGGVLMIGALLGSSAVALAAWPLTPMSQESAKPTRSGPTDVVQIGRRVDVAFPEAVIEGGAAEVVVDVKTELDAQGGVISARTATVTIHGTDRVGAPASLTPAVGAMVNDMVAAAVDAMGGWRFRPPPETPAVLIVRIRFAAETRQAIVTRISALSGYPTPRGLRVGGAIKPPMKIVDVAPEYPEDAKELKIQGVVILDVSLTAQGVPEDVQVLRSIPQLDDAAVAAVRQWRYQPTLMNGVPTPVQMTVTINFSLAP